MFTKFKRNTRGNVATMFSLVLTTVLIGIGAAIDYSGVVKQKESLQDTIDAATLAAASSKSTDLAVLQEIVDSFIQEIDTEGTATSYTVNLIDDEIIVSANSTYETYLMGLIGKDVVDFEVKAAAPLSKRKPIKLALVLDTTESMSGDRLDRMIRAANRMIQGFIDDDAQIAVSVVPFGKYVNIGTSRNPSPWLDVSKDGTSETEERCWNERIRISPRVCTPTGRTVYRDDIRDGVNFGVIAEEEQDCTGPVWQNTGNTVCQDRTTSYEWHGCVGSREAPYNEQAKYNGRRINGIMNESCGTEFSPLTTNLTDVQTKISSFTTAGNTYIPSGVMWGWRTLQEHEPINTKVKFENESGVEKQATKIMLVMTDGANTLSQGGDEDFRHDHRNGDEANQRTANICEAAKEDGVTIYTLGFLIDSSDTDTLSMLRNCASTPENFYQAGSADGLTQAFEDIAGQFEQTRLSL